MKLSSVLPRTVWLPWKKADPGQIPLHQYTNTPLQALQLINLGRRRKSQNANLFSPHQTIDTLTGRVTPNLEYFICQLVNYVKYVQLNCKRSFLTFLYNINLVLFHKIRTLDLNLFKTINVFFVQSVVFVLAGPLFVNVYPVARPLAWFSNLSSYTVVSGQ